MQVLAGAYSLSNGTCYVNNLSAEICRRFSLYRDRDDDVVGGVDEPSETMTGSLTTAITRPIDPVNRRVMLSSSSSSSHATQPIVVDTDQESYASANKAEERSMLLVPQPILIVAPVMAQMTVIAPQVVPHHVSTVPHGMFECKACKKLFSSHQALGGHRASHKKTFNVGDVGADLLYVLATRRKGLAANNRSVKTLDLSTEFIGAQKKRDD
uniref:C2H2-type domain-containing protein n=1 Tax=Oryza brachyantha TaxID=4533 RepID=J3LFH8_ORYBR